jgi:hypothetical protein
MAEQRAGRPVSVAGPTGRVQCLESLPPPDTRRWVARRKAEVVAAVRTGLISFEDACRRYNLSDEEFGSWQRAIDRHGLGGLRVTRIQEYGDRLEAAGSPRRPR